MNTRTTWTIHNVTDPERPAYVGHYTGWWDAAGDVGYARVTAERHLAALRAEWPSDVFELSRQDR